MDFGEKDRSIVKWNHLENLVNFKREFYETNAKIWILKNFFFLARNKRRKISRHYLNVKCDMIMQHHRSIEISICFIEIKRLVFRVNVNSDNFPPHLISDFPLSLDIERKIIKEKRSRKIFWMKKFNPSIRCFIVVKLSELRKIFFASQLHHWYICRVFINNS